MKSEPEELETEAENEETEGKRKLRQELSADEALARLREGKPLENVRVEKLHLRGEFPEPLVVKNCTLIRPNFDRAIFQGEVAIVGSTLDRPTFQGTCTFEKGWNLSGTVLNKAALSKLLIRGNLNLTNALAKGKLLFNKCQLEGKVDGWELRVDGWFDCKGCSFADTVDLRSIHVAQGLNLRSCRFEGDLLLRGAVISKKVELQGSYFAALLDLSKAKLNDFVYLEQIEQGPQQKFAFLNAVTERILVQPAQLQGRLASECAGNYTDAMHEYGLLKKSFQNLHRFDQEDWSYYRFKVCQSSATPATWQKPTTKLRQFCNWLFLDLGCGYGTNPYRAIRSALVIIFGFTIIYCLDIEGFHIDKKPFPELEVTDWPNRILISLLLSVSVFTSGLSGIRDLARGWMNIPLIVESLMGTLLWGLFIVAFSRKVIR